MWSTILILFSTQVLIAEPFELMRKFFKHKVVGVNNPAIQVHGISRYEVWFERGIARPLIPVTTYQAVTDKYHQYIVGILAFNEFILNPLLAAKNNRVLPPGEWWDFFRYERVKVRIDGGIANVTEIISENDPLNQKYFHNVHKRRVINVQFNILDWFSQN